MSQIRYSLYPLSYVIIWYNCLPVVSFQFKSSYVITTVQMFAKCNGYICTDERCWSFRTESL